MFIKFKFNFYTAKFILTGFLIPNLIRSFTLAELNVAEKSPVLRYFGNLIFFYFFKFSF